MAPKLEDVERAFLQDMADFLAGLEEGIAKAEEHARQSADSGEDDRVRGFRPLLKQAEVAEIFGVSMSTVCRMVASGKLAQVRISKRAVRITAESVDRLTAARPSWRP